MNGAQHISNALRDAMTASDAVHLIGESLPISPACGPLLLDFPDRCHLLPAADSTLVGVAIGLAIAGKTPVVELSGPAALWGALQQLGQETESLIGEFGVTMILRVQIGPEDKIPSVFLEGLSNVQIASPSEPADAGALLNSALQKSGITVLLEPATVLASSGGVAGDGMNSRRVEEGDHITLLAWGNGVQSAQNAAKTLRKEAIGADIIDLRCLAPLDLNTIAQSVNKTGRVILIGGSDTLINHTITASFLRLESPPVQVEPDAAAIVSQARAAIQY